MIETRAHTVGPAWQKETGWIRTVGPIYDFAQKSAPCRQSCPAGHDISWALNLVRNEDFKGALALFREDSPFPSITGRVCYHPCESKCNRGDHDQPLAINALERAMSHYADAPAIPQNPTHSETVAVVGSGPAGLTAAYHLVLLGYPVTVIEKHPKLGGALRYGIPEYRLPSEILDQEIGRLTTLGVQFQPDTNIGVDLAWTELRGDYDAVFLGIGLSQGTALRTPGIESVTARSGLEFLHEVNRVEISQLDGEVLVIGSGDVAMDVARSARRLGALGVHVASLEKRSEMTCHPAELSEALEEGVRLHDEWSATHIAP
ncbi:MAG: FAD-dependent oxidoreductase, partial [Candidatus Latescibacteria bacterium]|nr:FAD-dependent oxidoreductase [Candidatus Latescibacterota bacterium]